MTLAEEIRGIKQNIRQTRFILSIAILTDLWWAISLSTPYLWKVCIGSFLTLSWLTVQIIECVKIKRSSRQKNDGCK